MEYTCAYRPPASKDTAFERDFPSRCRLIQSVDELQEVIESIPENALLAGDTETNGLDFEKHHIVGFSFATSPMDACYVPLRHLQGGNCDPDLAIPMIYDFHTKHRWLYYNWTFDGMMWRNEGWDLSDVSLFMDVRCLVYNADNHIKANNLKWAAEYFCGRAAPTFSDTIGAKGVTFDALLPEKSYFYACCDAADTFALHKELYEPLMMECPDILSIDLALCKVMAQYYLSNVIWLNREKMAELGVQLRARITELNREVFKLVNLGDGEFVNLNSPDQVVAMLRRMGLDTGSETATGKMSVDEDSLLALNHPVGKVMAELHSVTKQLNSYVDKMSKRDSGRVNYKLFNTPTGRLASGSDSNSKSKRIGYFLPINYQNFTKPGTAVYRFVQEEDADSKNPELVFGHRFFLVPKGYMEEHPDEMYVEGHAQEVNVRNAITVPYNDRTNWLFLGGDYCSEELKVIGGLSKDPVYLKAFKEHKDLYRTIAAQMHGVEYDEVTTKMRKEAKIAVLGLNYGGNAGVLFNAAGGTVSMEECEAIVKAYWKTVSGLEKWQTELLQTVVSQGCVVHSAWGRPRRLARWLVGSREVQATRKEKSSGVRYAKNHIVQGTAGDAIRIVLVKMYHHLFKKYPDDIKFIGCIHDELNIAIRKEAFKDLAPKVRRIMTITPPGSEVELDVDFQVGYSYGTLFPFEEMSPRIWLPKRI